MAKPKVEGIITADSSGFQVGMAKAIKSLESLEKTSASMSKQAKLLGVAIWAAVGVIAVKAAKKIIDFGKELTELGQKSISLKRTFHSLATSMGADSAKLLADMKKNTRGMISEVDLITAANRMMLAGIDTSIFGEIVEIAKRTAGATGQSMEYMLSSLSDGLAKQSKQILDNLGIVFSVSDAYKWYGEEIGKVSSALTENEKRLAFQNYAMKIARENFEKIGGGALSLRGMLTILGTTVTDLKAKIGEKLVEAINQVAERFGGWYAILDEFEKFIKGTVIPAIDSATDWVVKFLGTFLTEDWSIITLSIKTLAKAFSPELSVKIEDAEGAAKSFAEFVKGSIGFIVKSVIGLQYMWAGVKTIIYGCALGLYDFGKMLAGLYGATEGYETLFGKFGETLKKSFEEASEAQHKAFMEFQEFEQDVENLPEIVIDFDEKALLENMKKVGQHYTKTKLEIEKTPIGVNMKYLEGMHTMSSDIKTTKDEIALTPLETKIEYAREIAKMSGDITGAKDNIALEPIDTKVNYKEGLSRMAVEIETTKERIALSSVGIKLDYLTGLTKMLGDINRVKQDISRSITIPIGYAIQRKPAAQLKIIEEGFQFGGIVQKTQSILAHGGEAVLTTEMQRNLIALLRRPQSVVHQHYTMGDVNMASQLMKDEGFITKLARQISMRQGKEVM